MTYEEIKALSTSELENRVKAEKDRMAKLKFAHSITPLENPMQLRKLRATIARMNTELSARAGQNA